MKHPADRTPPDEGLSRLLDSWEVPATIPPRFADGVWHRIAVRDRTGQRRRGGGFATWLRNWLAQPRLAAAFMGVVLVVGAGAGAIQGHVSATAWSAGLQARYVQSIDPFAPAGAPTP